MDLGWLGGDVWRYASLPVISAVVGYATNLVALRMMFYPIEFRGVLRPYLGWQGIVPRKASKMTGVAVDTLTDALINEHEIFSRIDSEEIGAVLDGPMRREIDAMAESIMMRHHPWLWSHLPSVVKARIKHRLKVRTGRIVAAVNHDMRANLTYLFDLDGMIVRALVREKELLNQIFLQTGHAEFVFIARSGLVFGFMFGLVQMAAWLVWHGWWLLPLFGLLVGWATNWLALKMIFSPRRARRIGPWRIQGLFFRRQSEVAEDYGRLVAERVLTPGALIEELLHGPYADKLHAMVRAEVDQAIDEALAVSRPGVGWTLGALDYEQIKAEAEAETIARMPDVVANAEPYLRRVLRIRETLTERLRGLTPHQFEAMLRPAFEEDEWILVAVGAALGMAVGWFQLIVVFYDVFAERFGALF
ncbi:DUF445 domain-containing protein [Salinisphaera sp. Q1T1-3]|uniref:DUF445 domain-containing protein n=1 Tax=Salinisphaera sp. Q1T1-3 TaxID=2321229 RepID=UPI000E71BF80|nr:DUF445 family protein [Salinisphaera sp. Q1T1-3]RJS91954.1 DUF445 family protein [Salinisphaera sp. Q1T1-3]